MATHSTMGMGDTLWIENVRLEANPHSGRTNYTIPTTQGNDYPQSYFSWYNGQYVLLSGYWDVTLKNVEAANISPTALPHFHVPSSARTSTSPVTAPRRGTSWGTATRS
jgi:hypothetical protein